MGKTSSSNVFRGGETTEVSSGPPKFKEGVQRGSEVEAEAPFTDYQNLNHHPFLVDYYKLGDTWKDKLGGFEEEITKIEGYFKDRIEQGTMKNEVGAVKEKIKKIYKLVGIDKSERTTMQIEKLAAYIDFLKKTDDIYYNRYRYAR